MARSDGRAWEGQARVGVHEKEFPNDKHFMEMYKKLGDKEMKMMEIEYTCKK